jgi:hypothetical protein
LHHFHVYQKAAKAILEESQSHPHLDHYICMTYYYIEVILAVFKEVLDDSPGSNNEWRSAHLDYHFAMAMCNGSFTKDMQKTALSSIKRSWAQFKRKEGYEPVTERTLSLNSSLCYSILSQFSSQFKGVS